ncbi:MAG: hypothetical protein NZM42_14570, partial [Gemmatales bacterium]|nr:hypothetical protein [Gemmatales bacterium]
PAPILPEEEPPAQAQITRRRIIRRVLQTLRRQFSKQTWDIFTMIVLQNRPVRDVAAEFGMTEPAVRQAKHRVLHRLRDELHELI